MGMVTMNCPGCGSPVELDDSREFGFCTYCGAKVMVDRMIVEHKGSVKIDNSEFVQKNLQNARRALSKEDWEEVEKYYNIVEQNAPHNMEAVFFSAYGKALLSLTDTDYFKREQKFKVLNNSISVLNDYFEETDENKEEVLKRIAEYVDKLQETEFVYNRQNLNLGGALNSISNAVGTKGWCELLIRSTKTAFMNELKQILEKHNEYYIKEMIKKDEAFLAYQEEIKKNQKDEKTTKVRSVFRSIGFILLVASLIYIGIFIIMKNEMYFNDWFYTLLVSLGVLVAIIAIIIIVSFKKK